MLEPVAAMTGLIERLRDTGLHSAAEAADALEALKGDDATAANDLGEAQDDGD